MKKIFAILLAAALLCSFAVPAFAAESDNDKKLESTTPSDTLTGKIDVSGDYTPQEVTPKVSVDVSWENMKLTYDAGKQGTWDPENLKYDGAVAPSWSGKGTITVTKHSNVPVSADFTAAKVSTVKVVDMVNGVATKNENKTITGKLSASKLVISSAEGTAKDNAPTDSVELSIDPSSGGIDTDYPNGILTVTVTIARAAGIDATKMDAEELTAAMKKYFEDTKYTYKNFEITLAADAGKAMFDAIRAALADSSAEGIHLTLKGVTAIPENALYYNNEVQDVEKISSLPLPDATSIGKLAFYGCDLTSISAPKVTKVSNEAFNSCRELAEVYLPAATEIGAGAFTFATGLKTISLPSVTKVGDIAFHNCSALTSISLPKCTEIGNGVFVSNSKLTSLTLGAVVKAHMNGIFGDASVEMDITNIHLTLGAGQKVMVEGTGDDYSYLVAGTDDYKDSTDYTNKTFLGHTFASVTVAESTAG